MLKSVKFTFLYTALSCAFYILHGSSTHASFLNYENYSITSPGSVWGRMRLPENYERSGQNHLVYELIGEQALRFSQAQSSLTPEIFVRIDLKANNRRLDYDNRAIGAIGARITADINPNFRLEAGARLASEYRWDERAWGSGIVPYFKWLGWWDSPFSLSGDQSGAGISTWGEVRRPYALIGRERKNLVAEGGASFSLPLYAIRHDMRILARAGVEASVDTQRLSYRNWVKPSLGAILQFDMAENMQIELGASASQKIEYLSGDSRSGFSVFATFSHSWNLDHLIGK